MKNLLVSFSILFFLFNSDSAFSQHRLGEGEPGVSDLSIEAHKAGKCERGRKKANQKALSKLLGVYYKYAFVFRHPESSTGMKYFYENVGKKVMRNILKCLELGVDVNQVDGAHFYLARTGNPDLVKKFVDRGLKYWKFWRERHKGVKREVSMPLLAVHHGREGTYSASLNYGVDPDYFDPEKGRRIYWDNVDDLEDLMVAAYLMQKLLEDFRAGKINKEELANFFKHSLNDRDDEYRYDIRHLLDCKEIRDCEGYWKDSRFYEHCKVKNRILAAFDELDRLLKGKKLTSP